ncbi:hypothetical protein C9374_011436 [Naegleria lovaniensis]|uniref:Methyltransferase type 11 domain-containing protein n=1 Tax=Naegleria lovaniensis TaxID=51637 RepID=A0AA88H4I3_NAELO|nr:uncharacterized protein C9374_011436 [Naegleria lovaniensis]KAG2392711.1 hypothetical protein C9374_011436 [Naegleria lovaniensis]
MTEIEQDPPTAAKQSLSHLNNSLREPSASKCAEDINKAYSSEPWWYDLRGFCILTFAYRSTLWHQMRFFGSHMGPYHLEVACGTGTLLQLILKWRLQKGLPSLQHVVGIDYAENMLEGAKYRFRPRTNSTPWLDDTKFEFLRVDAAHMPFPDAHFDSVNIANSMHCLPDFEGSLKEMIRVLKPYNNHDHNVNNQTSTTVGTLTGNVLLVPTGIWPFKQIAEKINKWGIQKGILVAVYTKEFVLDKLREQGLEIVHFEVHGNCLDFVARKISQ